MKPGFLLVKNTTLGELLPFAGQYGRAGIKHVLRKKKGSREQLIEGANLMLKVAKEVLAAQTTRQVNLLLLQDGQAEGTDEDSA